jgi:hypothetical protein
MSVIDKLRTTFLMAHEEEARNEYTYVFPAMRYSLAER